MSVEEPQLIELLSDDQILSIMCATFGEQTEVVECSQIHGGHFNTLYDVKTVNPDHRVVLRVAPRDNPALLRYERTMMLTEPVIYNLMRQAGVPTSQVFAVDGSKTIIDRDYMILDYIDAVPMNHQSVPADTRPQIMREVGRYTALMHGITGDKFGRIMPDGTVMGSESWAEVFGEIMAETLEKSIEAGMINPTDADVALGCYGGYRAAFDECCSPVLVHNDIWDPNILVKEKDGSWQIEAIIDADRAIFADREFEFILWDNPDQDLMSGYNRPLDTSENAALRRKFYRMQLYMLYAWFYLVMKPSPDFQAVAKKIAMDTLGELVDKSRC